MMPTTCCVTRCRSDYGGTDKKLSLFSFPTDAVQRESWKRAIPRQEAGGFTFDSKSVRVCEKHFGASGIIRADEYIVNGDVVTLQWGRPKLKADAIPGNFEGLPVYLSKTKLKLHSRPLVQRPQRKRYRYLSRDGTGAGTIGTLRTNISGNAGATTERELRAGGASASSRSENLPRTLV